MPLRHGAPISVLVDGKIERDFARWVDTGHELMNIRGYWVMQNRGRVLADQHEGTRWALGHDDDVAAVLLLVESAKS